MFARNCERKPDEIIKTILEIAIAYRETAKLLKVKSSAKGFDAEPTHQQVMSELAQNPPSPHLHDAMLAVAAKNGDNWRQVHKRIEANQELWALEDANAPRALLIRYSWLENGVHRGPHEETVSITLPSSLAARFDG